MKHELLHEKAVTHAKTFHRAEADLIDILQEIDAAKTFLHYQCTSLHAYCFKFLKLSEANTSNFIAVARKAREVPELKEAIRNQELTVSKARKIAPVINKDNSAEWLNLAKTLPKPKLEKEVAKVAPQTATPETAKYVSEERIKVSLGVFEKTMQKLRRAQDLVSQKTRKIASMEDALEVLLDNYLEKNDPVEEAKRLVDTSASVPGTDTKVQQENIPGSRKISAQTKHQINLRDQGQCTSVHEGKRCENKRWLEIHHKVPLSQGGNNNLNNLTTLCWSHHRMQHVH